MTTTERAMPPLHADERTTLEKWLDFYRATLASTCEGRTDEELRTPSVPPSPLTLLGLVQHMAEVERNWFRRVLLGEQVPAIFDPDADTSGDDGGFDLADSATFEAARATWEGRSHRPAPTAPIGASTRPVPSWARRSRCGGSTTT